MKLGPDTLTRRRAGAPTGDKDDYGNPILGPDDESELEGCNVQPGAGLTIADRRDATSTLFTVWAPPSDTVETDRLVYAGTEYAIDGQIERWRPGRGDHDVIRLRAVAG